MIRAEQLTRHFGPVRAVDQVSFEIPRGRIAGFLGPNGAGKTTTMRMLCGVLAPDSGRASIDGIDVQVNRRGAATLLGWLPEGAPAYGELRVDEYLRFRASLYGPHARRTIDRYVDQCGLADVRRRLIGHLSRGFRQRVALAASLVHEPAALVLDEPGTGLDPVQQHAFRALLRDLAQDRAILLSTHQLGEASAVCDDLLIIGQGRILAQGTIDAFRSGDASDTELVIEASGIDLPARLSSLEGVSDIRALPVEPPWQRVQCRVSGSGDRRAEIARAVQGEGVVVRELASVGQSLEQAVARILEQGVS